MGEPLEGEFNRVTGAVLYPDGSVIIAESATSKLMRYDRNGALLWTFGRAGAGPGEFRAIFGLVRCRNGLLAAYDPGTLRVTFVTDAGTLVGSKVEADAQRGQLIWCQDTTDVAISVERTGSQSPPRPGSIYRAPIELVRYAPTKAVLANGASEFHMTSRSMGDLPFGERVNAVAGADVAFLCQTGVGTCQVHRFSTRRTDTIQVRSREKRVTDADWEHARSTRAAVYENLAQPVRDGWARMWAELPKQSFFGRFEVAFADPHDRLWVRTYEHYRQPTDLWLVLTSTGAIVAQVVTPSGLEPLAWSDDLMLGMTRDADGLPVLQRYRVSLP